MNYFICDCISYWSFLR